MEKLPQAAMKLLAERVVSYGITLTRTSNCWNDFEEIRDELHDLRALGMDTIVNLIYTVSPRHTDDYYARKAHAAAAIRPYRICFKDVGGLLTPERARTLLPAVLFCVMTTAPMKRADLVLGSVSEGKCASPACQL